MSKTKKSFQTSSEKLSLLSPIIIGEFEISAYKYMERPEEFIEKLLRDEIMNSIKIKNADKKDDKLYKQHLFVNYYDSLNSKIQG